MKAHTATRDVDDDNNNDNLYNMKKKLGVLDIDVNIKNNHNDEHGDDDDVYQEFYQTVTQSTFPYVFIREVCQLQQSCLRNNRSSNEKSLKGFPNYNEGIKGKGCISLIFTYINLVHTSKIDWNRVFVTAEIRPITHDPMYPRVVEGDILPGKTIFDRTQSHMNKNGSLLPMKLTFIEKKKWTKHNHVYKTSIYACCSPLSGGYMYGWKSTRWSSGTRHHVQFVIYERLSDKVHDSETVALTSPLDENNGNDDDNNGDVFNDYIVRKISTTSEFTISSTRHVR